MTPTSRSSILTSPRRYASSPKLILALLTLLGVSAPAAAAPIMLSATLTGDARLSNPDGLILLVTITGDTTSNVTSWTVDLESDTHADAALHEFYFDLLGDSTDYQFTNFAPLTWSMTANATAKGSGGASFMFEVAGPNNSVTNDIDLTFDVVKQTGFFTLDDFLLATGGCSNDAALGCGQLGAHIGSLGPGGGLSGFAMGGYVADQGSVIQAVPEPATLTLLALGLSGIAARHRRRRADLRAARATHE